MFHWNGTTLRKFQDSLVAPDSLQRAGKDSELPEKFGDGLESFQMAWKVTRWPGKLLDGLESY